jgi:RNA-directed DNA polymerase
MESVTHFITHRLKLKVNQAKSAVARPGQRKFLGFSFTSEREPRRRIAPKVLARFKERIRELTRRTRGISLTKMVADTASYLRGWLGYFGECQTPSVLQRLEAWLRRRLRSVVWTQWKQGRTRFKQLRKRGVSKDLAAQTAGSARGPWRIANSPALSLALPNAYFDSLGLRPWSYGLSSTRRTAGCRPACPVVWQGRRGDSLPYADYAATTGMIHLYSTESSIHLR